MTTKSRQALHELLDLVKRIDEEYLCETRNITSESDIVEGHLWLTHMLKCGLESYVDNHPQYPHFTELITPTMKYGGDGPDHRVFFAPLQGSGQYVVRGRLQGEVYLSFTVHTGEEEGAIWANGVVSHLNQADIEFEEDGSYEIIVSAERPADARNWLALNGRTISMITRHYFENLRPAVSDPECHVSLTIEPLGDVAPPLPLSDETLARKFADVGRYLRGHTIDSPMQTPEMSPTWFSLTPNELPQPEIWQNADGGGYGAVDNAYSACPFLLGPEEALVMEGVMPPCTYANVVLWNRYLQTFDHRYRQIGLNRNQMDIADDGSFRIVIAHRDPGLRNWLDTEGRPRGTIYWRFLMPEIPDSEIVKPTCKVVPFSEIA